MQVTTKKFKMVDQFSWTKLKITGSPNIFLSHGTFKNHWDTEKGDRNTMATRSRGEIKPNLCTHCIGLR